MVAGMIGGIQIPELDLVYVPIPRNASEAFCEAIEREHEGSKQVFVTRNLVALIRDPSERLASAFCFLESTGRSHRGKEGIPNFSNWFTFLIAITSMKDEDRHPMLRTQNSFITENTKLVSSVLEMKLLLSLKEVHRFNKSIGTKPQIPHMLSRQVLENYSSDFELWRQLEAA